MSDWRAGEWQQPPETNHLIKAGKAETCGQVQKVFHHSAPVSKGDQAL